MKRHGWRRLSRPGRKLSAHWRHDDSGWEVKHCGHMTALWPYYLIDPAHPEDATVTHNGLGFRELREAMDAVEGIVAGRLRTTAERCVRGTRIVVEQRRRG